MINLTNSYKVSFVKKSSTGKTMFSIRDYEKDKAEEKNYAKVCALNSIELSDGDEIIIEKITGIGLSQSKGKLYVMIFGIVKQSIRVDKPKETPKVTDPANPPYADVRNQYEPVIETDDGMFDTGPLLEFDTDQLPF